MKVGLACRCPQMARLWPLGLPKTMVMAIRAATFGYTALMRRLGAARRADIDGEAQGDSSGVSVSLSSDGAVVAIGATQNDGNGDLSGHVRVYGFDGGDWVQRGADIDGERQGGLSGVAYRCPQMARLWPSGPLGLEETW